MRSGGEFCFDRKIPGIDVCFMGGGSGGGSSGAVVYPLYMMLMHQRALGIVTVSLGDVINAWRWNSPFKGRVPYNPVLPITRMQTQNDAQAMFTSLMPEYTYWPSLLAVARSAVDSYVYDTASADNAAVEFDNQVDADVDSVALPRFKRGMQTVNAVCSSAFVVGQAVIEAEANRNKCKFKADLYLQNYRERTQAIPAGVAAMLQMITIKSDAYMKSGTSIMEDCRQTIVARKEECDTAAKWSEMHARWDLDLYTYYGNLLASIGSASVKTGTESHSGGSGLGAAMAGIGSILSIAGMIW